MIYKEVLYSEQQQQQHSLFSQASWGRLKRDQAQVRLQPSDMGQTNEPASKLLSKHKHMKQKEKILFFLTPTLVL